MGMKPIMIWRILDACSIIVRFFQHSTESLYTYLFNYIYIYIYTHTYTHTHIYICTSMVYIAMRFQ